MINEKHEKARGLIAYNLANLQKGYSLLSMTTFMKGIAHVCCISPDKDMQSQLRSLAQEVVSDIAAADPARSQELLSAFVSELVLAIADESRREERRQRQAEGIAAAKARGVRFGRPASPVPDNFDKIHQEWRAGKMSLQQAAEACSISKGTFYGIAVRKERAESCAG